MKTGTARDVYVADRGNKRIQVFDAAGRPKRAWSFPVTADSLPYMVNTGNSTISRLKLSGKR